MIWSYFKGALAKGLVTLIATNANASMLPTSLPLHRGYLPIHFVSPRNINGFRPKEGASEALIQNFCAEIQLAFKKLSWTEEPCGDVDWRVDMLSAEGHPLIYAAFGSGPRATLFLGGVHPDELTPIHLAFRFARHLTDNPDVLRNKSKVIIAPLVSPDGFIKQDPPIRTNGRVDVNRNFFTMDWYTKAEDAWRTRRQAGPRYFPGYFPNTEVETLFQIQLIDRFLPDKIFSVHAPLGFLDYDGPGDQKPRDLSELESQAKQLVYEVSRTAKNYRIVDYAFYPGSLGNYAGNERNLPTITLELETTNPALADEYWEKFLPGFVKSIEYPFHSKNHGIGANATRFFRQYDGLFSKADQSG